MSDTADMVETPLAARVCAVCKWSRDEAGEIFQNGNRAFCSHPSVNSDTGAPVPCESQRFPARGSGVLQQCGVDGILFEART